MNRDGELALHEARMVHVRKVAEEVGAENGIAPEEVLGRRRTAVVARARHELFTRLWERGLPLSEIGRVLGYHHTSVMYAVRRALGERYPLQPYRKQQDEAARRMNLRYALRKARGVAA